MLLSLAANFDWPLQQLDVKNVFLNGNLKDEVYIDLPSKIEMGKFVDLKRLFTDLNSHQKHGLIVSLKLYSR